ncbi:MAG: hypothetical protein ACREFX_12065 [Opitutaceae bacterium]
MIRWSLAILLLAPAAALRAAGPPILNEAIHKLVADENHWAFTQKSQEFDRAGKPIGGLTIERFDPSRPYDRQWRLLQYRGHAPTLAERVIWKHRKARLMRHAGEKGLGQVLDLARAIPVTSAGGTTTFLVPIRKHASRRYPGDKLEVFMDVNRKLRALTAFSLRPKRPFRIGGVVKVDHGEVDGRLEVVQAKYAPALVWVRGDGEGRVFGLVPVGRGEEVRYDDFRRVRPYGDRFEVKIGDVKALDF